MQLSLKVINRRMTEDFTMSAITPTATVGSSKSSKLCKLTLGSLRTINNAKATDSTYIVNLADSNVSTKDDE